MEEIILPYASIKLKESIVYCTFKNIELGFPEIQEVVTCIESLTQETPYLILADVRLISNITNQGKRMLEKYNNIPFCNGTAILIYKHRFECTQNLVDSYKMKYPMKAFTSEQTAGDWLLSLSIDCQ